MPPKRSRLFAKDYILDIVEANDREDLYYYIVHNRVTGEIIALGHEETMDRAQATVNSTFRDLTGENLVFESVNEASAAS